MNRRGISSVLGFIILTGLVAITSTGMLLSAGGMMGDAKQEMEHERVEQAMLELNSQIHQTVYQSDTTRGIDLGVRGDGAVVRDDAAQITVESAVLEQDVTATLGTVEWTGDDGTKMAAEGGAVFRKTGGRTRIVSPPPVFYDFRTSTLEISIVTLSGDRDLDAGDITLTQTGASPHATSNVMDGENVTITVDSEYCAGWEAYFVREVSESSIQEHCGDDGSVTVQIGSRTIGDAFESGVNHHPDGSVGGNHGDNLGDPSVGYYRPLDDVIHGLIEDAKYQEESGMDVTDFNETSEPVGAGVYFVEGDLLLEDTTEFNLSEGNVTLIVEGSVLGDGNISARNPDNSALRVYAGGDRLDLGGTVCTDGCTNESEHIQIYGTSEMAVSFGPGEYQGAHFEGIIYAPSYRDKDWEHGGACDGYQFAHQAGGEYFRGSVVTYSACSQGEGYEEFEYDGSLGVVDPFPPQIPPPPSLTYLNVAEHEIEIDAGR